MTTRRDTTTQPLTAGHSAQREYERRRAARRARLRARYGALGSAWAALVREPCHTTAWRQGAEGEAEAARQLETHLRRSDVSLLHDRRVPGRGRANIDHLAIGPGGVTVIDSKSSRGRVTVASTGLIRRRDVLIVGRRDRTNDLEAVARQVQSVIDRLERFGVGVVDVRGALCFPYLRRPWTHRGSAHGGLILVDDPRHIAKLAARRGPLSINEVTALTEITAEAFPQAVH